MISGRLEINSEKKLKAADLEASTEPGQVIIKEQFGLVHQPWHVPALDTDLIWIENKENGRIVFFEGHIFNREELGFGGSEKDDPIRRDLHHLAELYDQQGTALFSRINGHFVLGVMDFKKKIFVIARDQLGIEPLFYAWNKKRLLFGSSLDRITRTESFETALDYQGLAHYLLFNYTPGKRTLIKGISECPAGHYISIERDCFRLHRYWSPDFTSAGESEKVIKEKLFNHMRRAVESRIGTSRQYGSAGAFLSGGMDSSSVVGLMSKAVDSPMHTFSFRCRGKSIDESYFAGVMAEHYGTQHHLVEFPPEKVSVIEEMAGIMDNPFCDIGIEVSTFLLGQEASNNVRYVMTGDGGDELFAGHPVYLADRIASRFDKVPGWMQRPVRAFTSFFPDSESKASFMVKSKRFAYSVQFPSTLYSNRWRIYYNDRELSSLISPEFVQSMSQSHPFEEIARLYSGTEDYDALSRALYGDYQTVVQFYLSRMRLLRHFGIESRFPMLDPELVEYAAGIPADFKIRGNDVKYILKQTMAGVLPDEIVFRKDKLGHSVPFKNWLRDNETVRTFVLDHLKGGIHVGDLIFKEAAINQMISEHLNLRQNHSHRLWALLVLKLWWNNKKTS